VGASQGAEAGDIVSDEKQKDRIGHIEVIAVSHEIVSPRDRRAACRPASGCTSRSRSRPNTARHPLLYAALTSNENLTSVIFKSFMPAPDGTEKMVYSHADERVDRVDLVHHAEQQEPGSDEVRHVHERGPCYQKIEWA